MPAVVAVAVAVAAAAAQVMMDKPGEEHHQQLAIQVDSRYLLWGNSHYRQLVTMVKSTAGYNWTSDSQPYGIRETKNDVCTLVCSRRSKYNNKSNKKMY